MKKSFDRLLFHTLTLLCALMGHVVLLAPLPLAIFGMPLTVAKAPALSRAR